MSSTTADYTYIVFERLSLCQPPARRKVVDARAAQVVDIGQKRVVIQITVIDLCASGAEVGTAGHAQDPPYKAFQEGPPEATDWKKDGEGKGTVGGGERDGSLGPPRGAAPVPVEVLQFPVLACALTCTRMCS